MAMLGDDGFGYELARKLESNGIWRSWLGDKDHAALQPHLASAASWTAFMQCGRTPTKLHLCLQLRVRALLYDKASVCLFLDSSTLVPPSSLDSSYLQLHADNVYFSLEQDTGDWSRLQAEGSTAISSLQLKYGSDLLISSASSAEDSEESGIGTADSRQKRSVKAAGQTSLQPIKTKQGPNLKRSFSNLYTDQSEAGTSSTLPRFTEGKSGSGDGGRENVEESDLWYNQWFEKSLLDRMHRLAWRAYQRKLPFKDREACQRTPHGMAAYLACLAKVRKKRCIFRSDWKQSCVQVNQIRENGIRDHSGQNTVDDFPIEEDLNLLPEVMFPWNCVPDNPVLRRKRLRDDQNVAFVGILDRLHLVSSQSPLSTNPASKDSLGSRSELWSPGSKRHDNMFSAFGKTKASGRRNDVSDEEADHLLQQAIVHIVAGAGFQGLKKGAMEILSQLLTSHIHKLGSILRLMVDSYRNQYSQKELLRTFIRNSGCGDFGKLLEYVKSGIRSSSQQQMLSRTSQIQLSVQPQVQQIQSESKQSTQQLSQQMKLLHQQNPTLQHQQLLDKTRRRQVLSPKGSIGSNSGIGRKSDKERVAGDIKMEMTAEAFSPTDPKPIMPNMPLISQQHQSPWQQQQQQQQQHHQLMQLSHPHAIQQLKQPSSLQLPSIPQQCLLSRDNMPTKMPHVKVEGLHELIGSDVAIKQESEDDREGVIGSPSRRKR